MSDRRKQPRLKTLGLSTPFGEVIDISDSGLGVFRKGRVQVAVGDTVTLHLQNESIEAELTARVVRIEPAGLFRHEIGFEFIGVDEETLTKVWSLADSACCEYTCPRCWVAA